MPRYPGFLGESSGRPQLSLFCLRTRTTFSFINKMDIVYHDNTQLPPSDGYLEGYYSEKLSRVLREALRLVYLNPFVLLNSHTDPAEPLDGTGVYPNTLSTNTSISIAVTSLPRIASNVMVSWRSPRPKADSCSLISTTGGCGGSLSAFDRSDSQDSTHSVTSADFSSTPALQILVQAGQTRSMTSVNDDSLSTFLPHHDPVGRLSGQLLWSRDCCQIWNQIWLSVHSPR